MSQSVQLYHYLPLKEFLEKKDFVEPKEFPLEETHLIKYELPSQQKSTWAFLGEQEPANWKLAGRLLFWEYATRFSSSDNRHCARQCEVMVFSSEHLECYVAEWNHLYSMLGYFQEKEINLMTIKKPSEEYDITRNFLMQYLESRVSLEEYLAKGRPYHLEEVQIVSPIARNTMIPCDLVSGFSEEYLDQIAKIQSR